ncbi:MAG TPA: hypothetical protein VHU91_03880 [Mycobacteriales bacterium]|jgi:hypothetical protein|nr:hypothetical protein [Mycobacteriales bacterium]
MSLVCTAGDQFPLGDRPDQHSTHEDAEHHGRPFGLQLVTSVNAVSGLDIAALRYDEDRQLSITLYEQDWVPVITIDSPLTVQSTGEVGSPNYDEIFDKN